MKYTIIFQKLVWDSDYYNYEADYQIGMVIIDNISKEYSVNGIDWFQIEQQ